MLQDVGLLSGFNAASVGGEKRDIDSGTLAVYGDLFLSGTVSDGMVSSLFNQEHLRQ